MREHRVFVSTLNGGETTLSGSDAQHLAQVLRVRPGARVRAFDGAGLEAAGIVTGVDPFRVTLTLENPEPSAVEASLKVTLAVALLKGDKLTEVVRRGTELGVADFKLFTSLRCDVRELSANKLERLRRVAQEAAKQSGRSVVPPVAEPVKLGQLELGPFSIVADPYADATLRDRLSAHAPNSVSVITGPEGGLDPAEVAALMDRGAYPVRLGARILRAETAPVALAAALLVPEGL